MRPRQLAGATGCADRELFQGQRPLVLGHLDLLVVRFQKRTHWFPSSSTIVVESPSQGMRRRKNRIQPTNLKQREQQGEFCNASAVTAFFTVTRTLGSTNIGLMMQRCITNQDQHTCRSTVRSTTNKNCNFTIVEIHQNISFGQKRALFFEAFDSL